MKEIRSSSEDKIKSATPVGKKFRAMEIANIVYPYSVKSDSEGRVFNRSVSYVAKILRQTKGILELSSGEFYRKY